MLFLKIPIFGLSLGRKPIAILSHYGLSDTEIHTNFMSGFAYFEF
jgi:hypothetical protein